MKISFYLLLINTFLQISQAEVMQKEIRSSPQQSNDTVTYNSVTNQISVPEGKILKVIDFYFDKFWKNSDTSGALVTGIKIRYGSSTNFHSAYGWGTSESSFSSPVGKIFYGPCEVEIYLNDNRVYSQRGNPWVPDGGYVQYILDLESYGSSSSTGLIPSASVVVPSNATGDVDVLLEQSTDMITWTQCLPGTYNASTQKRFFRVRAVEK